MILEIILLLIWTVVLIIDAILTKRLNKAKNQITDLLIEQNKLLVEQVGLLADQRNTIIKAIVNACKKGDKAE